MIERRSPSPRALPAGLLGMLALVAAIDGIALRNNLEFMNNVMISWDYTGRLARRKAPGNAVLLFGDSLVKFGILPRFVKDRTGEPVYNLAIQSGAAPSSYFLLRRALAAGARPRAVVVDFARNILADGPSSPRRPYPWADLLTLGEALELSRTARDPDFFTTVALRRVLHSYKGRHEIRANVMTAFEGKDIGQREVGFALQRNWNIHDGGQANPKVDPFDDPGAPPNLAPRQGDWRSDPTNERYLDRFCALAERHGITVYWLLPPVTPGTLSLWEFEGNEARYVAFVRRHQSRFPNLVVIDGRHSGYGRDVFDDGVHLDRDGAIALSLGVGAVLREHAGGAARWVKLPDYQAPATEVAVEDVPHSSLYLQALWSKRRR